MGIQVKTLLSHLRQRQQDLGVRAFYFQHILRNNELEPAAYSTAVKDTLSTTPKMEPGPIVMVDSSSLAKSTKSRTPAKRKSPVKSKRAKTPTAKAQVKLEKIEEAEEEVPLFTTPLASGLGSTDGVVMVHPQAVVPNIAVQTHIPQDQPQYDPNLVPTTLPVSATPQNGVAPEQGTLPLYHPTWAQQPPLIPMPSFPAPFNPSLMTADPHQSMMFQHLLAQFAESQGWHPIPPPQQGVHNLERQTHGFHPSGRPLAPGMIAAPHNFPGVGSQEHLIPPGDPPFSVNYPSHMPVPNHALEITITPLVCTPTKKTPGKRKRENNQESQDTPSMKPTRVSNRIRTPRKFIEIE